MCDHGIMLFNAKLAFKEKKTLASCPFSNTRSSSLPPAWTIARCHSQCPTLQTLIQNNLFILRYIVHSPYWSVLHWPSWSLWQSSISSWIISIINIILKNINPHLLLVHGLPSHPCPKLGPRSEQVLQVTNNKFYSRVLYPSNSHIFQWNKNIFFLFRQDQFLRIKTFPFYLSPSASFPFPGLVDWAVSKRALDGSEEKMRFSIKEASFLFFSLLMIWFSKSAQPEMCFSDIVNRLLLAGETSQPGAELSSCVDRGLVFAISNFNQDCNSSLIITFWL